MEWFLAPDKRKPEGLCLKHVRIYFLLIRGGLEVHGSGVGQGASCNLSARACLRSLFLIPSFICTPGGSWRRVYPPNFLLLLGHYLGVHSPVSCKYRSLASDPSLSPSLPMLSLATLWFHRKKSFPSVSQPSLAQVLSHFLYSNYLSIGFYQLSTVQDARFIFIN